MATLPVIEQAIERLRAPSAASGVLWEAGRLVPAGSRIPTMTTDRTGLTRHLLAWSAHALTASGAVLGLLALLAIEDRAFPLAFFWLALSVVVDAVDGTFARWVEVEKVLPRFDGFVIDSVVDYFTYVILPVVILLRTDLMPARFGLAAAALILVSSCYTFSNTGLKTSDNFFNGFPACWNGVVFYLYVTNFDPWVNLSIVLLLVVTTPIPIKYVHPVRVRELRPLNLAAAAVWLLSGGGMLIQQPRPSPWLVALSLASLGYLWGLGLLRTFRPREERR